MNRAGRMLAAAGLALLIAGCATPREHSEHVTTFVLVRHAEKAADDPRDPGLTDAGRTRAARLAASLADAPLRAVYATAYRRTRDTAGPSAVAHGLQVAVYDAREPAADFAERLRAAHPAGTVLVVGHSNTAPAIAAALCACPVAPMREDEFDRRIEIRVGSDGLASPSERRY
jgi:broad specificity phosphatase PhoE